MEILLYITIFFLLGVMVWMIKYLEKKLPEKEKRLKKEWEEEVKRKEKIKSIEKEHEDEIQKIINIEKKEKEILNKKENHKKMIKDNIRKGRDYELFIIDYYRKKGYKTKGHGVIEGKKDKGIDVIVMKNKEITLIQCKNWKADSKYKINHEKLSSFLGKTETFLKNNQHKAEGYTIKRLFVTSNYILDKSGEHFLNETNLIEYKVIPMSA